MKTTENGLLAMARSKGYVVERAMMRDYRRLRDNKGELALHPITNSIAFSIRDASAFLNEKPDQRSEDMTADVNTLEAFGANRPE